MNYEQLKEKYPDLNWQEAEEIGDEDLTAAVEYYDKLVRKAKVENLIEEYSEIFRQKRMILESSMNQDEFLNTDAGIEDMEYKDRQRNQNIKELPKRHYTCMGCKYRIYFEFEEDGENFHYRDCANLDPFAVRYFDSHIVSKKSKNPIPPIPCPYYKS